MTTQRRTRTGSQHRGWTPRKRTTAALARDIAASIAAKRAAGVAADASAYTTRPEVIALVATLLK